jgi:hypothetical protein
MRVISLNISSTLSSLEFIGLTFTINISITKLDNYIYEICNNGEEVMNTITIAKNSLLNKNNKVNNIEELIDVSIFKYKLLNLS